MKIKIDDYEFEGTAEELAQFLKLQEDKKKEVKKEKKISRRVLND